MDKKQLRQYAKDIRAGICDAQHKADVDALLKNISHVIAGFVPAIHKSDRVDCRDKPCNDEKLTIGVYCPVGTEIKINMHPDGNYRLTLPVIRHDKSLEFYEWQEGDKLITRDFNIPIPDTRHKDPIDPDIIFAPLLLCDLHGNRLGYGKGHYDRYISGRNSKPLFAGVCFDEQIYEGTLPAEDHDVKLDIIITPKRVIKLTSP
jgi:5-formyltetrahydrofolate cyclo-ligase